MESLPACYFVDAINAGYSSAVDDTDYFKKIKKCPEDDWLSPTAGFTFITIRNDTGRPISNVEISYRVIQPRPTISEIFQRSMSVANLTQLVGLNNDQEALSRYFSASNSTLTEKQFLSSNLEPAADLEKRKDGLYEVRKVSTMRPGESVIFLLNIHVPDSANLPLYFLDDTLLLTSFGYDVAGKRVSRPIRPPAGKEAARKTLAWGWYSQ